MLIYLFVRVAEEAAEESAGRVPGPELHRLKAETILHRQRLPIERAMVLLLENYRSSCVALCCVVYVHRRL